MLRDPYLWAGRLVVQPCAMKWTIFVAAFVPSVAFACKCASIEEVRVIPGAAIMRGTAVSVERGLVGRYLGWPEVAFERTCFDVVGPFGGPEPPVCVAVRVGRNVCGYEFVVGRRYSFWVSPNKYNNIAAWITDDCHEIKDVTGVSRQRGSAWLFVLVGFLGVLAGGLAVSLFRRGHSALS